MIEEPANQQRAVCLTCFRPRAVCFCRFLVPVENRTPVWIVQHPHERFHPIGTARIAERCLCNVHLEVDYNRVLRDGLRPLEFPDGAALLYPGPEARDLASIPSAERPRALVILDGTWHQTRSLYRDIPALHRLPKFSFTPRRPSQYRIRKEPGPECVSTIEALVYALELIEPETRHLDALLRAFAGMIDLQLEAAQANPRKPRFSRGTRPRGHGLPGLLTQDHERIVVVYGEAAITDAQTQGRKRGRARHEAKELIQWVARRLRTGERFSAVIEPETLPSESRLCATGLTTEDLCNGLSLQHARRAWHEFVEPQDILLCWNKSTLDIMHPLKHPGDATFLKGIYKNFIRRRDPGCDVSGSIDTMIEREGLHPAPTAESGRADRRLAQLETLTRYIHACGIIWPSAAPPRIAPHS